MLQKDFILLKEKEIYMCIFKSASSLAKDNLESLQKR